ncbi:MAG: gamma-glutamyltransferase [Sulfolobaceae archaeon]|nr:gamma-glutamyltransferase [Sulfolobaceae archaeon]
MPSNIDKKIVVSQHFLATIIGKRIFELGGNAFDAIIATSAAVSLLLPHTSGLGGDAFLLASTPEGIIAYNASGWAPKRLNVERFSNYRDPRTILVPGLVDLWHFIVSNNYNKLPLEEILKQPISLASNGYYIGRELANAISRSRSSINDSDWHILFGSKEYGDLVFYPKLAEILKKVAKDPRSFYEGEISENLVVELKKKGLEHFEVEDFKEFRGEKVKPIKSTYKDYELFELPPNSQGITTLELLKMIELDNLNDRYQFFDEERVKRHVELTKLAYSDRDTYITDPKFADVPVDKLLSVSYLRDKIRSSSSRNIRAELSGDTTFLIAADEANMVALIQSLFYPFGSGVVVNDIVFNNRGFSFTQGVNKPEGRKRPLHTLSILYADNTKEQLIIGCAGGYLRPQIHAEVFEYYVDYKKEIDQAVYAPRFMLTDEEGLISEQAIGNAKQVTYPSPSVGIVQAVKRKREVYIGVSDIRAEGLAL